MRRVERKLGDCKRHLQKRNKSADRVRAEGETMKTEAGEGLEGGNEWEKNGWINRKKRKEKIWKVEKRGLNFTQK